MKIGDAMGSSEMQGTPVEEAQPAAAAPAAPANADRPEPTPEEQRMYDQLLTAGLTVLNNAEGQILKMLKAGSDNPPKALSDALWAIMSSLVDQAQGDVDEGVLMAAGYEMLENLVDTADAAGVFSMDEQLMSDAWSLTLNRAETELGVDWADEMSEDQPPAMMEAPANGNRPYPG